MGSGYVGRFAPSPTGRLHFGSLIAATASCLDARSAGGKWLVRIEDIDTPRVRPGAADDILRTLEQLGFEWDGPIVYQSRRTDLYRAAFEHLRSAGLLFPCACTRKNIAETGDRYQGTCRAGVPAGGAPRAWRIRVNSEEIWFEDRAQGWQCQNVEAHCGDFVIVRADGLFSYQFAVVVDDREQGVTDVVRGADLLDSTARQIYLQRQLGALTPRYLHLPVAVNQLGQKLSKQTLAPAIETRDAFSFIWDALDFLGQTPSPSLHDATLADVWRWAAANWSAAKVPKELSRAHDRSARS